MLKNIKTINKRKRGNMDKQLNNFLTSIGDNTIKNEITSMSIVQRNNELFQENKFKVNNDSIYSMLGIKAPNQILTETRGFETVDRINMERKRLVDRIILPLANFKNLVESDKEKTTKLEKKKTKEKNKAKPEPDHTIKKSDEKIRANAIRTTANRVLYPSLFIMSLDKSNYKFDKKVVRINLFCLKNEIVKSILLIAILLY
jgi:superfamily II RNA helicase